MNKSILLVDDDDQLRLALRHVLAREGYDVTEAEDGDVALEKLAESAFDLILMDIIMPNREGIETIIEIKKKSPRLKIVAMSGGARMYATDPLKLAAACGADFVIAKPFPPSELRDLVKRCWTETKAQTSSP